MDTSEGQRRSCVVKLLPVCSETENVSLKFNKKMKMIQMDGWTDRWMEGWTDGCEGFSSLLTVLWMSAPFSGLQVVLSSHIKVFVGLTDG